MLRFIGVKCRRYREELAICEWYSLDQSLQTTVFNYVHKGYMLRYLNKQSFRCF